MAAVSRPSTTAWNNNTGRMVRVVSIPASDLEGLLNVRDGAGVKAPRIAQIRHGQTVTLLGGEQQVGSAIWVRVNYGEGAGWVNSQFLVTP
jgi:uncharacterized protein YraI